MQRGAILHLNHLMIITFFVLLLLKLATLWKCCYTQWGRHTGITQCVCADTDLYIACVSSMCICVSKECPCILLSVLAKYWQCKPFIFIFDFVPTVSPLSPLLLCSHSGSLFSILRGASPIVEWSWQRASSRLYLAHSKTIVNGLKRARRDLRLLEVV